MTATGSPLVVANWKLHGDSAFIAEWLEALKPRLAKMAGTEVVVCPPAVYLARAGGPLQAIGFALGAQDLSDWEQGAYTGEISARMLRDVGCAYVIVGHSERRRSRGEDNALVARKFSAALAAGLTPILCVGETLEQRENGEAGRVVAEQLTAVGGVVDNAREDSRWVIAYEPVWAIGTGHTASVGQVVEMHAVIRACPVVSGASPAPKVVYGGSIKPDNARSLLRADGVDGGLVGAASLDAEALCRVCAAARGGS